MDEPVNPHIGAMLRKYVDDKRIHQAAWARLQKINKNTVRRYFKRSRLPTDTLFDICHVLHHNFFADLAATLPDDYTGQPAATSQKVTDLQKENEILKAQVEMLKELVKG